MTYPGANVLHLTATTTGAQTVTIQRLTPTGASITITWGDGSAPETIANGYTGTIPHNYAGAGTYPIVVSNAAIITAIDLRDAKLGGFNTAELRRSVLTYFYVTAITASTIRSADMVAWRPTNWRLYSMPAGTYTIASADMVAWRPTIWYLFLMPAGTYTIASADMVAWRPTNWYLSSMPAGTYNIASADMVAWRPAYWYLFSMPAGTYAIASADMVAWTPTDWYLFSMPAGTYTIASADMVAWTPTQWRLYLMPAGTYTIASADMVAWRPTIWYLISMPAAGSSYTFAAICMRNWTGAIEIRADGLALLQAVVDTIVADIYAGRMGYTYATPALNVGGTNAAPSGVYADEDPPVTGKGFIYELVNDPEAEGFKKWAITYTP
jgi:hypothetical protein